MNSTTRGARQFSLPSHFPAQSHEVPCGSRFLQCINRERKQQRMLVEEKRLLLAAGEDSESIARLEFVSDYHSDGCDDSIYELGGADVRGQCRHSL